MERRGLLAKEEVVRSFAPVGQREKHTANYTQVIIAWTMRGWEAAVKHGGNFNMPYNYCLCWGRGSRLLPDARTWAAQPSSPCKHCTSVEGRWRAMRWWGWEMFGWQFVPARNGCAWLPWHCFHKDSGNGCWVPAGTRTCTGLGFGHRNAKFGALKKGLCAWKLVSLTKQKKTKKHRMNYFTSTFKSSFTVPLL